MARWRRRDTRGHRRVGLGTNQAEQLRAQDAHRAPVLHKRHRNGAKGWESRFFHEPTLSVYPPHKGNAQIPHTSKVEKQE